MSPLPPEVAELLAAKDAQIAALTAQVRVLLDRVAELERSAGRNSSNSGKPPSSDSIFDKDTPKTKARDRSARERVCAGRASSRVRLRARCRWSMTRTRRSFVHPGGVMGVGRIWLRRRWPVSSAVR